MIINNFAIKQMTQSELKDLAENFIRSELRKHLPPNTAVYLFGSRAKHTANWNADYDLWIDNDLATSTINAILEVIDESFVPFKLDIVTTPQLHDQFGNQVRSEAKLWMQN